MILVAIHSIEVTTPEGRAAVAADAASGGDERAYPWHNPSWNRIIPPGETFDTATYEIADDEAARLVVEGWAKPA